MPNGDEGLKAAEVGHRATEHGEGGDDRFEKRPDAVGIDWNHGVTVGSRDARVLRRIERFSHGFVAIGAPSIRDGTWE